MGAGQQGTCRAWRGGAWRRDPRLGRKKQKPEPGKGAQPQRLGKGMRGEESKEWNRRGKIEAPVPRTKHGSSFLLGDAEMLNSNHASE